MMLETLFAHQQQGQVFLTLTVCGTALGLRLHLGSLLRRPLPIVLWDALTAVSCAIMVFMVILRYQSGLRAYGVLGLLLGILLYLAGAYPLVQGMVKLFRKYKNSRRPKAGNTPADDESTVQKDEER